MKRLNAYRFTETFIAEGIAYLTEATIPVRFQYQSRKNEFRARYQGMRAEDGQLYVGTRLVVPVAGIDKVLAAEYKALGDLGRDRGRDRFYAHTAAKYIGISRPRVQQFLNNQELHQLVQHVKEQRVNIAIIASKPMERWQADLVDMSKYASPQNRNTTFLLTVIDCFSKHAWVMPLRNKEATTVAAAIETIFAESGAPAVMQTDNGGEFEQEFGKALERWGVQHARSRPYNPQANGQIERFNGTLKRMIHAYMLREDTKTYIPQLQNMVSTYNQLLHSGTNKVPAQLHTNPELWPSAHTQIKAQAMRGKRRGRQTKRPVLAVGDYVRTSLLAKALEKPTTFWSREVYRVMSVERPTNEWEAELYTLHDGRRFTRDRLQKIDPQQLVHMKTAEKTQQPPKQKAAPPTIVPKILPQRERAPTTRLRDTYLDL